MILLFLLSFSILPIILGFLEIFLVEKIFNINNMEDVLLPEYQVKENFIKRDYEFYVELRRELSTNRNRY